MTEREEIDNRDLSTLRAARRKSRRDFLALGLGAVIGWAGWKGLRHGADYGGLSHGLRAALEANEALTASYFRGTRLAPTFARVRAREPRVNGMNGLGSPLDPTVWRLEVVGPRYRHNLTLEDVKQLPRAEMTTELHCIEGWSVVVHWAGVRFMDFAARYAPDQLAGSGARAAGRSNLNRYVGLETPDRGYYVGMDLPSALHPQTLLCYEMNDAPLTLPHGAPLRLVTTVKYGIKSIKRVARVTFTDRRPDDFWAERSYDYYAGL
jgi:DMSO/TMAO reductase YedYZ molybdopterin-dependent catalytic subunit